MTNPLASASSGLWWMVVLRGVFAVIFGIIALIAPGAALAGMAIVFGVYALIDGVTEIIHAVQSRGTGKRWGWLMFQGIVSVLAGLIALIFPGLAGVVGGLVALWTIVVYAIVHGALGIRSASGAQEGAGHTWGVVSAVFTLIFGIILGILILVTPGVTLLGLIWTVGVYAMIFGILLAVTGIQLRRGVRTAVA